MAFDTKFDIFDVSDEELNAARVDVRAEVERRFVEAYLASPGPKPPLSQAGMHRDEKTMSYYFGFKRP